MKTKGMAMAEIEYAEKKAAYINRKLSQGFTMQKATEKFDKLESKRLINTLKELKWKYV